MKIRINGSLLYFDVENPGLIPAKNHMQELPSMIVLHGGPGFDHTPYQSFFSALRESAQIIYLDQHGNGRSDAGSEKSWNFARWASDISEFCQTLSINKPIIFGHSFGGMVALEYAIRYPKQLSKLILCATSAKFDVEKIAQAFFKLGGDQAKQALLDFFNNPNEETKMRYASYCGPYGSVQKIDEKAIFYDRLKLKMDVQNHFFTQLIKIFDCTASLNTIQTPTLILTGKQDPLATVEMASILASNLGNKLYKHVIVPQTSHNLIWEKTELVMDNIKEFIEHCPSSL